MNDTTRSLRPCVSPWPERAHDIFYGSCLTLHEVGVRMGYPHWVAHRAVWYFLYRTPDPSLSELRKFADAVEVQLSALLD